MNKKEILSIAKFVLEDQRESLLPQSIDHPDCVLCKQNWNLIVGKTLQKAVSKFSDIPTQIFSEPNDIDIYMTAIESEEHSRRIKAGLRRKKLNDVVVYARSSTT